MARTARSASHRSRFGDSHNSSLWRWPGRSDARLRLIAGVIAAQHSDPGFELFTAQRLSYAPTVGAEFDVVRFDQSWALSATAGWAREALTSKGVFGGMGTARTKTHVGVLGVAARLRLLPWIARYVRAFGGVSMTTVGLAVSDSFHASRR